VLIELVVVLLMFQRDIKTMTMKLKRDAAFYVIIIIWHLGYYGILL